MMKDVLITLAGKTHVLIENYISILDFSEEEVLVRGKNLIIHVRGRKLVILYYDEEEMMIGGLVSGVEYR